LTIDYIDTTTGQIWYYTIRVHDGIEYSSSENSPSVSIGAAPNQAPVASNLNFSNPNPITIDYLFINWTFFDADSDPESGSMYYWYRNGVYMSQYDGLQNLSASATAKGEVWHVKVRPRDGTDFGNIVGVPTNVTIGNTAPTASNLEISPISPKTGNDLTASYTFNDIDTDGESGSEIVWYKDGALQPALNNSLTIQAGNTSKSEEWHFKIRPNDGTDFGTWVSCPSNVTILNTATAPSASSFAVTPSNAKTGDELNATYDYSDVDGDGESGSYIRWFKNGIEQPAFENNTIIPAINTSKGQTWYFTIQPKDGSNYGTERTSAGVTILNTALQAILGPILTIRQIQTADR
jgi:hypothetical protein